MGCSLRVGSFEMWGMIGALGGCGSDWCFWITGVENGFMRLITVGLDTHTVVACTCVLV